MATTPDLEEKMDSLLTAFANMGQLLKDMQKAIAVVSAGVTDLKEQSKTQDLRIVKLEEGKGRQELRINNLEDRQRRSNLRLRGFKQDFVEGKRLIQAIHQWFGENNIKCDPGEYERAHWVFGPRSQGNQKDVIVRFVSERRAAEIFRELKQIPNLHYKATPIRVLKDLSAETLQTRNQMRSITTQLYEGGIRFTWRYPATIIVFKDSKVLQARSLDEGKKLLQQLGIDSDVNLQASTGKEKPAAGDGRGEDDLFTAQPTRTADQGKDEKIAALQKELALLQEKGKKRRT